MTDANGAHASWQYDHFGRLLSHTDIGGAVTRVGYDSAGQMVTQTTQTGQDLRYAYDPAGKLVQIVDAANRKTTTYSYDAAGNRVTERTVQIRTDDCLAFRNCDRKLGHALARHGGAVTNENLLFARQPVLRLMDHPL
jgi:YD repeat-containing protein